MIIGQHIQLSYFIIAMRITHPKRQNTIYYLQILQFTKPIIKKKLCYDNNNGTRNIKNFLTVVSCYKISIVTDMIVAGTMMKKKLATYTRTYT